MRRRLLTTTTLLDSPDHNGLVDAHRKRVDERAGSAALQSAVPRGGPCGPPSFQLFLPRPSPSLITIIIAGVISHPVCPSGPSRVEARPAKDSLFDSYISLNRECCIERYGKYAGVYPIHTTPTHRLWVPNKVQCSTGAARACACAKKVLTSGPDRHIAAGIHCQPASLASLSSEDASPAYHGRDLG